jgi:hypothetical protein
MNIPHRLNERNFLIVPTQCIYVRYMNLSVTSCTVVTVQARIVAEAEYKTISHFFQKENQGMFLQNLIFYLVLWELPT